METKPYIEEILKEVEPSLDNHSMEKFSIYSDEIKSWNEKFNLTSITDDREIAIKHFADSLYVLRIDAVSQCETLLDLGSGAGLPGIPIAIVMKDKKIILVESNNKKIAFLEHIKQRLELNNVSIVNSRAEDMSRLDKYREKFDCAISRALAKFPISLEVSIGLIKKGGIIAYFASQKQKPEVYASKKAMEKLKCEIEMTYDYSLKDGLGEHSVIIVKKMWKTSDIYPRQFNKIKRNPL
jgi:16S rRNA (guanine527-N7)-methyltransferase